jgi:hypothetical protein
LLPIIRVYKFPDWFASAKFRRGGDRFLRAVGRVALAAGDHHAAVEHLDISSLGDLTPRAALVRQVLLAAAAIERGDPEGGGIVGGLLKQVEEELNYPGQIRITVARESRPTEFAR